MNVLSVNLGFSQSLIYIYIYIYLSIVSLNPPGLVEKEEPPAAQVSSLPGMFCSRGRGGRQQAGILEDFMSFSIENSMVLSMGKKMFDGVCNL